MPNNFRWDEFMCPCCGWNIIQAGLVERLQTARTIAGVPFKINSGCRCAAQNKEVGGEWDSSHMKGWAVDVACETLGFRFRIIAALIEAGFTRLGIGKTFVHADCDPAKPPDVIWVY